MTLRVIQRSNTLAISVDEMAQHLRRTDTEEEDALIEDCIVAATEAIEEYAGLALVEQTLDYYRDSFPDDDQRPLVLPRPPLLEVIGVFYRDSSGASATLSGLSYELGLPYPAPLYLPYSSTWPSVDGQSNAVRIRYRAGFLDESASPLVSAEGTLPARIKQCLKLYAAALYGEREKPPEKDILEMVRFWRMETSIG